MYVRKTKLICTMVVCLLISVMASAQLSISVKNTEIKDVLAKIEQQSDYTFFYSENFLDMKKKISINEKNRPIESLLAAVFKGTDVQYRIENDKQIILSNKKYDKSATDIKNNDGIKETQQQGRTIRGKVLDASGFPLPGTTVIVKGTVKGTTTDQDGNYLLLNVPDGATLVFSFMGMKTAEIAVRNRDIVDVTLEEESIGLEEVVAIGYGVARKSDLTGAVVSVSHKHFSDQPVKRVSDILQGRTPGVEVTTLNGMPGGSVKVRVRGTTSINKGNDPLYIVDGIVAGGLEGLNPSDIQSIEVLKDASATAIYGSRGANGVVLVTTRKGVAGKNQIVFDVSTGIANIAKTYDVMNAYEYAVALNDIKGAGTISDADLQAYKNGTKGIDWQKLMIKTGYIQDYKLSFSGGTNLARYLISANILDQDATTITSNFKRYSLRANIDSDITSWLTLSAKLNASRMHEHNGSVDMDDLMMYSPTMEMKDEKTGIYNVDPYNSIGKNPYGKRVSNYSDSYRNNLQANGTLLFNIMDGLTFSLQGGYFMNYSPYYWFSSRLVAPGEYDDMVNGSSESRFWQNVNNLTYSKTFGKHSLTAMAVWEVSKSEGTGLRGDGSRLNNGDIVGYWNIKNAASREVSNSYWGESMASGLSRVMYNYGGRYFLTGTFRADGSSKFQGKNKWSYFPSGAVAWDIAKEEFMGEQELFGQLKLRASYGITGNQGIGAYNTLGMLTTESYSWGTTTGYTGYWAEKIPAAHLRWEKSYQYDFGLDFSMLNNRVSVSIDYFNKQSKDLLFQKPIPLYNGGGNVWVNQGQIDNRGIEFAVTAFPLDNASSVVWETSLNASYLKNTVVDLAGDEFILTAYRSDLGGNRQIMKVGYPYGSFHLYKWKGFDDKGAYLYEKADGSLTTSPTGSDQQIIGQATPKWTFGWNNMLTWKNWTVNLFLNGATGFHRLNQMKFALSSMTGPFRFLTLKEAYDKNWEKVSNKADALYPNYKNSDTKYFVNADKWLENASFLKIRNVSVSYNLPKSLTRFAGIQLTVSGQNLFTLTKYSGMDPETYTEGDGIDGSAYPQPRVITLGAKFTF